MRSQRPDNGLKPLPKERRHPADYRDEEEHRAVAAILAELPPDHIAVYAYSTAARSSADSTSLAHLLVDRMDLVERLVDAADAGRERLPRGVQLTPAEALRPRAPAGSAQGGPRARPRGA